MDTARYAIAVVVIAFVPFAVIWWCLIHPFVRFWRRVGPVKTLSIMGFVSTLGAIGLISVRDRLVLTDYGYDAPLVAAAATLFSVSVWIWLKRRRLLTTHILLGIPELEKCGHGGELLTDGIYGHIRHPRYVEIAVGTLAYALFSNYLGAYIATLAFFPLLHVVVLLEERELHTRFGDAYEAYCQRVPRYIPWRSRKTRAM